MKTKEDKKTYVIAIIVIILFSAILYAYFSQNDAYATETSSENNDVEFSNAKEINIYKIIRNNNDESQKEEIETKEEVLEFMTKYKTNKDLPKGTIQVLQEGREGLQQISLKKTYKYGELVNEEQIGAKITKASIDKIVEIGDANYSSNYQVKVRRHCLCNC